MPMVRGDRLSATFGRVIARHRTQRGWTLRNVAAKSGMTAAHIGILERGNNTPTINTLFLIAEGLGVRPSDLVRELEELFYDS